MNREWLHRSGRNRLILFCNGWGMDSNPVRHLEPGTSDVLHLFNFREPALDNSLFQDISRYQERVLICWSMGVWAGQKLFMGSAVSFSRVLAINGTLCPIDSNYGIPRELFTATMENWSEETRRKFYKRMCGSKELSDIFEAIQPDRNCQDQQCELKYYLESADCLDSGDSIFTEVIVSTKDRIVPTDNQLEFWKGVSVHTIRGGHYLFKRWQSWDELLAESELSHSPKHN